MESELYLPMSIFRLTVCRCLSVVVVAAVLRFKATHSTHIFQEHISLDRFKLRTAMRFQRPELLGVGSVIRYAARLELVWTLSEPLISLGWGYYNTVCVQQWCRYRQREVARGGRRQRRDLKGLIYPAGRVNHTQNTGMRYTAQMTTTNITI